MINAIISEFNPFHNGHKYLIEKAKLKTNADATVCIMSGNFVQRGEAALWDKHERAAMAIKGGADLVLQIPTAHSLSGASVFARSGVYIASALGIETSLCFGSEDEDITPLYSLALIDRQKLANAFKSAIDSGISYAQAAQKAYEACNADASIIKSPNNLLAFEYIKEVIAQKSDLKIVNIKRVGTDHDSDLTTDGFASASFIRNNLDSDMSGFAPEISPVRLDTKKLEDLILFSIYSKTANELSQFADMTEGIENRFFEASKDAKTYDMLCQNVKSKRYTASRIRRTAINVLLQNPKGLYKTLPDCIRVLAFNDKGRALLNDISKKSHLPVITKPADYKKLGSLHFELEVRATDIFDFCCYNRKGKGSEYKNSPIYIKE